MPVLKNARHEKFAQAVAKGKSATEAYEEAGYKPDRKNAARLTTNDDIRRRVDEIKSRVAEKAEWTAADRLISLKSIHDASLSEDRRTAIAAIAEANKMQGSYAPTKNEHTGKGGGPIQTVDLSKLSDDEFNRLEAILGSIALDGGDQSGEGEEDSPG
ncbi:terminase small subunit [Rhizobium rhizogenes]|uniref:terminase small subunit n=1 Tax=Rhizobium rhizogenes TaxID=359 RepID=UPI0004D93750|nr:terminase small subunit [Rhizobium rhizogenes]KEA07133.1 hypothetical protein CN09_09290 [Rhizobium rhizogenes]NTI80436.1 hypothetical protein [Rhizobium rhizogenes]NTJ22622.1 hypothetical protein [Rhizobium rhizogenes]QUE81326.1 terminase small subunit [Rhizobium rhizogenes]TQO80576.1 hypothetical protein FFE80_05600 [Rhizobium rhizogenes]